MPSNIETSQDCFIGRARELAALDEALTHALSARGRLVLLSGEPGIGKTRLADEFSIRAASRSAYVVSGRCWEGEGAPPYWPIIQIVRALIARDDLRPVLAAFPIDSLAHIASIVPEVRQRASSNIPDARPTPTSDGARSRFELFDAVTQLLRAHAAQIPMVLLIDDLHDADLSSLQMLAFIARGLKDSRVMLLGTHRDAEVRRSADLSKHIGELQHEGIALPLGGLSRSEVADFVETRAGSAANDDLVTRLYAATEGNPLFVDGVVRLMLTDEFEPRRESGGNFKIPQGVRESIRRQLSALPPETVELLKIGAAIGNEFEQHIVEGVSTKAPSEVATLLEPAIVGGVISGTIAGHRRLRFSHALIRGVVYEDVSLDQRPALHLKIGSWLEARHHSDLAPHLAALAYHFREAHHYEKAIGFTYNAGAAALEVYAHDEALAHWDEAIALIDEHQGDRKTKAHALTVSGAALQKSRPHEAVKRFEEAISIFEVLGLPEWAAQSRMCLGGLLATEGQMNNPRLALAHLKKAEPVFRTRTPEWLPYTYYFLATVARRELRTREAVETIRHAVDLAEEQKAWEVWATSAALLTINLMQIGELSEAEALGKRLWEKINSISSWFNIGCVLGAGWSGGGRLALLWDCRAALEWHQWLLNGPFLPDTERRTMHSIVARSLAPLGEVEQARRHYRASGIEHHNVPLYDGRWESSRDCCEHSIATNTGSPESILWLLYDRGRIGRLLNEHARPISLIEDELQKFATDEPHLQVEMMLRPELALLYIATDRLEAARAEVGRCEEIVSLGEDWRALFGFHAHAAAALSAAQGRQGEAEPHFVAATTIFRRFGLAGHEAETLIYWGKARQALKDEAGAQQKFDAAVEIYRRCGFGQRWIDRVEEARRKPTPKAISPAETPCTFHREGEFWTVAHGSRTFRLKDMKGLHYIAHLLAHPDEPWHVHDLIALTDREDTSAAAKPAADLRIATNLGDAGPLLDARAKAEYRKRRSELKSELADAERANDPGAVNRIRAELEKVDDQLSEALGLGGRDRKAADNSERSRSRVARAIRGSLNNIRENDASLGHHLSTCIRTGYVCAYHPDPEGRLTWQL